MSRSDFWEAISSDVAKLEHVEDIEEVSVSMKLSDFDKIEQHFSGPAGITRQIILNIPDREFHRRKVETEGEIYTI
jgi:hypothetical protein